MSGNYEIVKTNKEKYVNYKVYVRANNETWFVVRRYKEFRALYEELRKTFPDAELKIPPKKIFGNFSQKVINERVTGLNYLVSQILVIPDALSQLCTKEFFNTPDLNIVGEEHPEERDAPDVPDGPEEAGGNSSIYGKKISQSDFEFKKVIGKGTFGKVYLAQHKETEMHYAIKVRQVFILFHQKHPSA